MSSFLPMTIHQADAQLSLRKALNDWINHPEARSYVFEALEHGARLDMPGTQNASKSLLHASCDLIYGPQEWDDLTQFIRASSVKINTRARDGSTPWINAAATANHHALRALLALGANTRLVNENGLCAIHKLCSIDKLHDDLRLESCLDIVLDDWPECSTLLVVEKVERFVGQDPDKHERDPEALNIGAPIHFAIRAGQKTALERLARAGADMEQLEPITHLRPLDLALQKKHEAMAIALVPFCDSVELDPTLSCSISPLWASLHKGWPRMAQALLVHGASPDLACDHSGGFMRKLLDEPDDHVGQGAAISFWKGYKAMLVNQNALSSSLGSAPSLRSAKITQ